MKLALFFLVLWQGVIFAGDIRRYQVAQGAVLSAHGQAVNDFVWNPSESWWGEVVAKPGFESGFFGGGTWLDVSKRIGEVVGSEDFERAAYFDLEAGHLVMKAEAFEHAIFQSRIEKDVAYQIRAEVALYSVPGVRAASGSELPKGAELQAGLSFVHLVGQEASASTGDGTCKMTSEVHLDHHDLDLMEVRLSFDFEVGGVPLSMKGGFTGISGMPWFHELGSVDGEVSWVAQITHDVILIDGTLNDEWILKEEGGAFLFEERLARLRKRRSPEGKEVGMRTYALRPTFIDFIRGSDAGGSDPDPFAVGPEREVIKEAPIYRGQDPEVAGLGALHDCQELLRENGIAFREGDFALFSKARSTLYAKLSETNFELLEGVTMSCGYDLPAQIRVDFEQVDEEGEIRKTIGVIVMPGQTGTVELGGDLVAQVEAQIDASDDQVEMKLSLSEGDRGLGEASFTTGIVVTEDVMVRVQESRENGTKKEWRVRANIDEVEERVERYLLSKEEKERGEKR